MSLNNVSLDYITGLVDSVLVKKFAGREYPNFNASLWKGLNDVNRLFTYFNNFKT